jgi:hypothetical protein
VQAWIALYDEDLMADWQLASGGEGNIFTIEPLR